MARTRHNQAPDSSRGKDRARISRWIWPGLTIVYVLGVILYFGFFATDRYVSTAQFAITRGSEMAVETDSLIPLLGGAPKSHIDSYIAINYIQSNDMLQALQEELDLRSHYEIAGWDWFLRLPRDASREDFLSYYQARVQPTFDEVEGIVTLEVEAFTPAFAQKLAESILGRTDEYLNEQNRLIARRKMKFVEEELELAEQELLKARQNLIAFQNSHATIDPAEEVAGNLQLIQDLKKEKLFNEAERMQLQKDSPGSPRIAQLNSLIEAFDQEIAEQYQALTGDADEKERLNELVAEYDYVKQHVEFTIERYQASLRIAENVRIQSLQDHRFFSLIQSPQTPDEATRPRRLYLTISLIVLGAAGLQVLRIIGRTIAEHRP